MSNPITLTIRHPEPARQTCRLIPAFLPFAGCPGRCIYCDQSAQTGCAPVSLAAVYDELDARLRAEEKPYDLGFYGGTFTGLERPWQLRFLELAQREKERGLLGHVRASTRPDMVTADWLAELHRCGLDMLELGVQSFDSRVLRASGRGYDREQVLAGCRAVLDAGLELGIQLLPGLPEHTRAQWRDDVLEAARLNPRVVRIYPCIVMENTVLAEVYARGEFHPWALEETVDEIAWAFLRFWEQGIAVIRTGIPADAANAIVAGPWHPAFGNMVRSTALRDLLLEWLTPYAGRIRRVVLPVRLQGELWGHNRVHAAAFNRLGLFKNTFEFFDRPDILAEVEI